MWFRLDRITIIPHHRLGCGLWGRWRCARSSVRAGRNNAPRPAPPRRNIGVRPRPRPRPRIAAPLARICQMGCSASGLVGQPHRVLCSAVCTLLLRPASAASRQRDPPWINAGREPASPVLARRRLSQRVVDRC
jgi:hypothetical protein